MKYFASLESEAGLNALPHNPCKLLGFDLLVLPAGEQHAGNTGDREVLAVILGGKATFEVADKRFKKVGGRPNVFAGKPHSVYLPTGVEYSITAEGPVQVAMTSAPSDLKTEPYVIGPERVANGVWGAALPPDPDRDGTTRSACPAADRGRDLYAQRELEYLPPAQA